MILKRFGAAAASCLLAAAAHAQTTEGFLFYAGGAINSGAATALDGTLTNDGGCFGILVADVTVSPSSVEVSNWRHANAAPSRMLPEDNPATVATEALSWMYIEDYTFVHDGRLYVGPGDYNTDATRTPGDRYVWADIDTATGYLSGDWNFGDPVPQLSPSSTTQTIGAGEYVDFGGGNAYVYLAGGNSPSTARVLVARLLGDGSLGGWTTTTSIPAADWFNRAVIVGGTYIALDGNANPASAAHYTVITSSTGQFRDPFAPLGEWAAPAVNRWGYVAEDVLTTGGNRFMVVAGGSGPSNAVRTAQLTGGVPGAWVDNASLPVGKRQMASVSIGNAIVCLGGANDAGGTGKTDIVQVGRMHDAGILTWSTSDNDSLIDALPRATAYGGAAFVEKTTPSRAANWNRYE